MRWLMQDLRCFHDLYFVDSRTDAGTVARESARAAGLPNAQRDVFLDNQQDPDYVRSQLMRLVAKARREGTAIGIGHPYPATLEVLAEGVKAADSFDALQVANAIRGLAEVQTPMGSIAYGSEGDLTDQKIYIFEVRDGDWVQVYPEGE